VSENVLRSRQDIVPFLCNKYFPSYGLNIAVRRSIITNHYLSLHQLNTNYIGENKKETTIVATIFELGLPTSDCEQDSTFPSANG